MRGKQICSSLFHVGEMGLRYPIKDISWWWNPGHFNNSGSSAFNTPLLWSASVGIVLPIQNSGEPTDNLQSPYRFFGKISNPKFTFSKWISPVNTLFISNSCIVTKDVKLVNEISVLSWYFFLADHAALNLASVILSNFIWLPFTAAYVFS